ncbi:hypothetical protein ACSBR1_022386 [Camellia fascicularis]
MTWLLLSCTSTLKGAQSYESVIQRVSDSGSLVEYNYDLAVKNISQGFQNVLDLNHFEFSSGTGKALPKVLLLSTKKDTPVCDVSDPVVRKLGVDALPAIVGWLSNGEKHTLKTRISVKDIKYAVEDLSALLDDFEKRNKKAASSQAKKPHSEERDKQIPLLIPFNFDGAYSIQSGPSSAKRTRFKIRLFLKGNGQRIDVEAIRNALMLGALFGPGSHRRKRTSVRPRRRFKSDWGLDSTEGAQIDGLLITFSL